MASKGACELAYEGNLNELRLKLTNDTSIESVTDQVKYSRSSQNAFDVLSSYTLRRT